MVLFSFFLVWEGEWKSVVCGVIFLGNHDAFVLFLGHLKGAGVHKFQC